MITSVTHNPVNDTIITHEITQLRIIAGLSWEELAKLFNTSPHQIRQWARGQLAPQHTQTHAQATLDILTQNNTGSAGENSLRVHHRTKAFEELCAGNYAEANRMLSVGRGRR